MRIDLHLHSNRSSRPSQWVLQKLGCPESFSDPHQLVELAKQRGMTGFTLTDHNTIDGCLEIAHLENTFISEEITTYFPEDGCKAHVLAWDIDEKIHADIQHVRENIFDLVQYLNQNRIRHALAHPLFAINDRLTPDHVEQFLLLFRTFELNGARAEELNTAIALLARNLTPSLIQRLADRHDLEPVGLDPCRKDLCGGSDDHSAINACRIHTRVPGARTTADFLAGLDSGRARPEGRAARPETMAHNLYSIAYQFYRSRLGIEKYVGKDLLLHFLDQVLNPNPEHSRGIMIRLRSLWNNRATKKPVKGPVEEILKAESAKVIKTDPEMIRLVKDSDRTGIDRREERWFQFVSRVSNQVLGHLSDNLFNKLGGANVFSIFDFLGSSGTLLFLTAPFFLSYGLFGRDRLMARSMLDHFRADLPSGRIDPPETRVAHFTDTLYEVNGVALTLAQQAQQARLSDKPMTILSCYDRPSPELPNVRLFKPIGGCELPEYPGLEIIVPPFLEILRHVSEQGYTHLHTATPGPVGLVALACAKILGLPISGTYHTAIPQYAARLTGDQGIEELTWRYTLWYYEQLETIYVPATATGQELIDKGIDPAKIKLYPRGVDTERFSPGPDERSGEADRTARLLYVGRVSREKNLHLLVQSFRQLLAEGHKLSLTVVGEGPYLDEMRRLLTGYPVEFTGFLEGDVLVEAYRKSDLFVFPSTTDTFGNVVLEAQAAGLPVIVSDEGGPHENILPGITGLIVPADDGLALTRAVGRLCADQLRLRKMAREARTYAEGRSFEEAFLEMWSLFEEAESGHLPDLAKAS